MNKKMKRQVSGLGKTVPMLLSMVLLLFTIAQGFAEDAANRSLSLSEGLRIATQESRVIKIADFSRGMAEQDINVALSRYFPSVNASAGYTMLSTQPGMNFNIMSVYTSEKAYPAYGVNFHQTVFDFFARESLYRASRESLELTERDIFRTKNIVALEFVNACFTLLEADKLLSVGQKEIDAIESHAKMAQNLYDAGTITKNDLLQAKVRLSDAQQRFLTLTNMRKYHAAVINRILTRPLNQELSLSEPAGETPPLLSLNTIWENAMNGRPEIKMADYEITINELKETAKKSEFLPSFFTEGGYSYSRNRYMINDDNWSIIFGLKFNIFSGGATRAELSKLKIRTEQLREQRKRIADDLKLEAERYYLDKKSSAENIAVTKEAVRQAAENLRINTVRYEEGVGTATDVLDAISLLTLAEKNHYKATYDLKRAHAGLIYSMGEDLTLSYK
jgi:outer membrane protein